MLNQHRKMKTFLLAGILGLAANAAMACGNGQLIFEDNFETMGISWDFESDQPNRTFGPNGLVYKLNPGKAVGQLNQAELLKDYEVCAVFTTNVSAEKGGTYVGVSFWFTDYDNGYWTYLYPTPGWGSYGVNRAQNGKTVRPVAERKSNAIQIGKNVTNEVSVIVKGEKATLFINGKKIVEFAGRPPQDGSMFGFNIGRDQNDTGTSVITIKNLQVRAVDGERVSESKLKSFQVGAANDTLKLRQAPGRTLQLPGR